MPPSLRRVALALVWLTPVLVGLGAPVQAHHLMDGLQPAQATALDGLLSGLGHPLLGPDHLLFLLALGLVGLQQSGRWAVALLAVGLGASWAGVVAPGLPGAEVAVALSLVLVGLVLCDRLPRWTLLPAFAIHGYVLSAAVIGWEPTPLLAYGLGLLLSQGTLLLIALRLVRPVAAGCTVSQIRLLAGLLMGVGSAFAWTALLP